MEFESKPGEPPSAIAAYRSAWGALRAHPGRLLLVLLVFVILQLPTNLNAGTGSRILGVLYQIFVIPPVGFGFAWVLLMAVRDEDPEVGDLFALFRENYLSAVGAGVVVPLVLVISALPAVGATLLATLRERHDPLLVAIACTLFVIPFFATIRLSFVPYLLAERGLGPIEVLGESWNRTGPIQMQLLAVALLGIPLLALGLLLLLVGVFPALLLAGLANAALFHMSPKEAAE